MPRLFVLAILFFFTIPATAQKPLFHWARAFNSSNDFNRNVNNNGRTVGVDAQGNVYSAGLFEYSIDLDPGPAVFKVAAANQSENAIFISKLNASGDFVWAVQIPTYVEFGQIELKVDKAGNVYLASDLKNPADMDPGPGVYTLSPTGFRDAFVVKLNTDGKFVWAKQFGAPATLARRQIA